MNEQQNQNSAAGGQSALSGLVSGLAEMVEDMERDAFELWATNGGEWPKAVERNGDGYKLMQTQQLWTAWQARAALHRPCRGVAHNGCNYLAPCGSICNKCGQHV